METNNHQKFKVLLLYLIEFDILEVPAKILALCFEIHKVYFELRVKHFNCFIITISIVCSYNSQQDIFVPFLFYMCDLGIVKDVNFPQSNSNSDVAKYDIC